MLEGVVLANMPPPDDIQYVLDLGLIAWRKQKLEIANATWG